MCSIDIRLEAEPDTFFGFWGSCFNGKITFPFVYFNTHNFLDYRTTAPHEGYQIIKKWRDAFFVDPTFKLDREESLKIKITENAKDDLTLFGEEDFDRFPGPFFVLTSNVSGSPCCPYFFRWMLTWSKPDIIEPK